MTKIKMRSGWDLSAGLRSIMAITLRITFMLLVGLAITVQAEGVYAKTYYVSTTGSGSVCSEAQPCGSITTGISKLSSGDTLIVKDGTYINPGNVGSMPAGYGGSQRVFTTIKAENPFGVRLKYTNGGYAMLNSAYTHMDGFIIESTTSSPEVLVYVLADYVKVTRCIFKRAGVNEYGGWVGIYGANYVLFEDCAGVGGARYGYAVSGGRGNEKYNIFRRCIGRQDFAYKEQPKAVFSIYGNNSTTEVRNHIYQNCIAIDSNGVSNKYGGMYNPKNATNITYQGCIVLNEVVTYAGIFCSDWGAGQNLTHCAVYDVNRIGIRGGSQGASVSYSTVLDVSTAFYNATCSGVTCLTSGNPADLLENSPGATILKRYGVSGTFYGDPGYDTLTDEDLWPWPYEDEIKAVFAEQQNTPSGHSPSGNVSARGFATGTSMDGSPQTLTKYIWEYTGTQIPDYIYRDRLPGVPDSPSGLKVVK